MAGAALTAWRQTGRARRSWEERLLQQTLSWSSWCPGIKLHPQASVTASEILTMGKSMRKLVAGVQSATVR